MSRACSHPRYSLGALPQYVSIIKDNLCSYNLPPASVRVDPRCSLLHVARRFCAAHRASDPLITSSWMISQGFKVIHRLQSAEHRGLSVRRVHQFKFARLADPTTAHLPDHRCRQGIVSFAAYTISSRYRCPHVAASQPPPVL